MLYVYLLMLFPVVPAAITAFVLARSHLASRVVIASLGFGVSGALILAACSLLWGIGGIPFRVTAALWAVGLNVLNLALGIIVIRRLDRPRMSPSQRDVPPPDAARPV